MRRAMQQQGQDEVRACSSNKRSENHLSCSRRAASSSVERSRTETMRNSFVLKTSGKVDQRTGHCLRLEGRCLCANIRRQLASNSGVCDYARRVGRQSHGLSAWIFKPVWAISSTIELARTFPSSMQYTDGVGLVRKDLQTNNERPEFTTSQAVAQPDHARHDCGCDRPASVPGWSPLLIDHLRGFSSQCGLGAHVPEDPGTPRPCLLSHASRVLSGQTTES